MNDKGYLTGCSCVIYGTFRVVYSISRKHKSYVTAKDIIFISLCSNIPQYTLFNRVSSGQNLSVWHLKKHV